MEIKYKAFCNVDLAEEKAPSITAIRIMNPKALDPIPSSSKSTGLAVVASSSNAIQKHGRPTGAPWAKASICGIMPSECAKVLLNDGDSLHGVLIIDHLPGMPT